MKKNLLIFTTVFLLANPLLAADLIPLFVGIVKDKTSGVQNPKSPSSMEPPVVYLEDYTLNFDTFEEQCTIQLLNGNGVVVFSSMIPVGATSFLLPTSLEGEYLLQIVQGNYCFYGYINL